MRQERTQEGGPRRDTRGDDLADDAQSPQKGVQHVGGRGPLRGHRIVAVEVRVEHAAGTPAGLGQGPVGDPEDQFGLAHAAHADDQLDPGPRLRAGGGCERRQQRTDLLLAADEGLGGPGQARQGPQGRRSVWFGVGPGILGARRRAMPRGLAGLAD